MMLRGTARQLRAILFGMKSGGLRARTVLKLDGHCGWQKHIRIQDRDMSNHLLYIFPFVDGLWHKEQRQPRSASRRSIRANYIGMCDSYRKPCCLFARPVFMSPPPWITACGAAYLWPIYLIYECALENGLQAEAERKLRPLNEQGSAIRESIYI